MPARVSIHRSLSNARRAPVRGSWGVAASRIARSPWRIRVDPEDKQVRLSIAADVGDGHTNALVEPGVPVRHRRPRGPFADRQLIIGAKTYAKIRRTHTSGVVDLKHHQVREPIGVEVGHCDACAGVLIGEPIWDGSEVGIYSPASIT
jgi:hypothetical protein